MRSRTCCSIADNNVHVHSDGRFRHVQSLAPATLPNVRLGARKYLATLIYKVGSRRGFCNIHAHFDGHFRHTLAVGCPFRQPFQTCTHCYWMLISTAVSDMHIRWPHQANVRPSGGWPFRAKFNRVPANYQASPTFDDLEHPQPISNVEWNFERKRANMNEPRWQQPEEDRPRPTQHP